MHVRALVESVIVDLEQIMSTVSLLEEVGIEVQTEIYQNAFYNHWLEGLPGIYRKFFLKGLSEKDKIFLEIQDYVLGMGSKLKTVRGGQLCVAPSVEAICSECYFLKICPVPQKMQERG